MNKTIYNNFLFFNICKDFFSRTLFWTRKSNNMTLDGNLEYVENNLIDAEALLQKSYFELIH